jgi:hypothetical protein
MPDRRTLRDIRSAYEGMKQYTTQVGQRVFWFRLNTTATTSHPIYDTGPQRVWYSSISVPVILAEYQRARRNMDDDGLYLVDHLHIVMSYDAFFHTGMPDPDPVFENHMGDRIGFDGKLFTATAFLPQGRVADYFLTISIDALEVAAEEMDEDAANPMFSSYVVAS